MLTQVPLAGHWGFGFDEVPDAAHLTTNKVPLYNKHHATWTQTTTNIALHCINTELIYTKRAREFIVHLRQPF